MKRIVLAGFVFLSACSSPPEPPQVDWKKNPETMNSQLMDWQPTFTVIKSDRVNSSWVKVIKTLLLRTVFTMMRFSMLLLIQTQLLLKVAGVKTSLLQKTGLGLTVHMD